jgi:hypothetical protein
MRHKLDIPTIIDPRQRVPELTLVIDRRKLIRFIEDNAQLLADFLNIFRLPVEELIKYLDQEFLSALIGFGPEHHRSQIASEAADRVWALHLKPKLVSLVHNDIVDQAISYTHKQHKEEIPFEEGKESRVRLMDLVADALTAEKIASHPLQFEIAPTYQLVPEDLQPYLNRLFTETVREIFATIYDLEAPLEAALYRFYFNDTVPTKFSLDMVERFHQGNCTIDEIVAWALARPDFFMQELLSNVTRAIDRNPNISPDEKLTQKAAAYQLLKSIFLSEKDRS